jgi:hypothetical protein
MVSGQSVDVGGLLLVVQGCAATSSSHSILWCAQMYSEPRARFFQFNYGPDYDLTVIRNPVILFSGEATLQLLPAKQM